MVELTAAANYFALLSGVVNAFEVAAPADGDKLAGLRGERVMRLQGKVVAITGGALGIGRATAQLFAAEGAAVALGDAQVAGGGAVAKEIVGRGGRAIAVGVDVGDAGQVQAFVDRVVAEFGRLDVMFANAGIAHSAPFLDHARASGIACCASTSPACSSAARSRPARWSGRAAAGASSPPRRSTASAASRTSWATTWPRPA